MGNVLTPSAAIGAAFVLSFTIAWAYTRLHAGAPYQRTFAQSLAVAGVVSALVVLSIGDSIARGIGLIGAVALVRFRSNLKDPRDLIFAFEALAAGVAAGAHAFFVGAVGTCVFLAGMFLVTRSWFARTEAFDAILTCRTPGDEVRVQAIARELQARCDRHALIRVRQTDQADQEHAYQVLVGAADARVALVRAIQRIDGVANAQLIAYDPSQDL